MHGVASERRCECTGERVREAASGRSSECAEQQMGGQILVICRYAQAGGLLDASIVMLCGGLNEFGLVTDRCWSLDLNVITTK